MATIIYIVITQNVRYHLIASPSPTHPPSATFAPCHWPWGAFSLSDVHKDMEKEVHRCRGFMEVQRTKRELMGYTRSIADNTDMSAR